MRFDVGILFEFATGSNQYNTTGLTKIVLLGSAFALLALEWLVIVDIRMDLVGLLDVVREVIEFDATLINSRLVLFTMVGDAAFRLSWGDRPYAMLTLGGFHPAFNPEPAMFPKLARLGLVYDPGPVGYWFRLELYFAITTNTIQLGGKIEFGVKFGPCVAVAWLGLDAMIQWYPFWFSVKISVGAEVTTSR